MRVYEDLGVEEVPDAKVEYLANPTQYGEYSVHVCLTRTPGKDSVSSVLSVANRSREEELLITDMEADEWSRSWSRRRRQVLYCAVIINGDHAARPAEVLPSLLGGEEPGTNRRARGRRSPPFRSLP